MSQERQHRHEDERNDSLAKEEQKVSSPLGEIHDPSRLAPRMEAQAKATDRQLKQYRDHSRIEMGQCGTVH